MKAARARSYTTGRHWLDTPIGSPLPMKLLSEKDWQEMQQFLETLDYSDLLELGRRVNNLWMQRALDTAADASAHDPVTV